MCFICRCNDLDPLNRVRWVDGSRGTWIHLLMMDEMQQNARTSYLCTKLSATMDYRGYCDHITTITAIYIDLVCHLSG